MEFTDTSEKGFQRFITAYLTDKTIGHGFTESTPHEFDRDFCVNSKQLLSFIEATQKDAYEMIQRKGCRLNLLRCRLGCPRRPHHNPEA